MRNVRYLVMVVLTVAGLVIGVTPAAGAPSPTGLSSVAAEPAWVAEINLYRTAASPVLQSGFET